ncbi:MAG: hypothetical protein DI563_21765 [Variovorax paradoxus]|uniref:Uncharacterized protein n=1 Tax=Variovorax paradoxus TaxID=34073 RepID=A0A2W5RVY5_VARPD|nr:MAG: hypothetical protein DI563_21765 [Variovorax paradoxus]
MATPNYGYEKRQKELAKKKKKEEKLRAKAERKLNPGSTEGADGDAASLEQDAPATPGEPPKDD